jgi:hypothetical protein
VTTTSDYFDKKATSNIIILTISGYSEDVRGLYSVFAAVIVTDICLAMEPTVTPSHLIDLTDAATPQSRKLRDHTGNNSKRKQTLLTLLDALHELSQDEEILGYGELLQPDRFYLDCNIMLLHRYYATSQTSRMIGMSVSTFCA